MEQEHNQLKSLVSVRELQELINAHDDVRIVDCRFTLGEPLDGKFRYQQGHIQNAVYVSLESDLSGEKSDHGGRHPLPMVEDFVQTLKNIGITESTTVVAYDDEGGAFATRLWWMLTYIGHKQAYVLNGGYTAWKNEGLPISTRQAVYEASKDYNPTIQENRLVTRQEVLEYVKNIEAKDAYLFDSRESQRFEGLVEPVDKIAGRIPGAKHLFWKDNIDREGKFKSLDEQKERFDHLNKESEIIVYCGSGVTACPNVLTLTNLGFENVRLYAGSWSDWISYEDAMIEKEETKPKS